MGAVLKKSVETIFEWTSKEVGNPLSTEELQTLQEHI